jgi:hypothetical protein
VYQAGIVYDAEGKAVSDCWLVVPVVRGDEGVSLNQLHWNNSEAHSVTAKPRYRAPGDPACTHPRLTRTVAEGHGFVLSPDAAVYSCPDCGYVNYGDVDSRFDTENLRRL